MNWAEFEVAAPEIAQLGRERLEEARVALLGTLRKDGSPRISPIEPFLSQGHLLLGAMSRSAKTRDLKRDPRCVLHSTVTGPDTGDPELKLYGHAVEVDDAVRDACEGAWWRDHQRDTAVVFSLTIERAVFVSWCLDRGEITMKRWSPEDGLDETTRGYP